MIARNIMIKPNTIHIFENLDTRLFTINQIRAASNLAVLAQIPFLPKRQSNESPERQSFHLLSTVILARRRNKSTRSVIITSANPNEGKSTIAANFVHSLAQLGLRVLLIDADMRLPTQHKIFCLPNDYGLSTLLTHSSTVDEVIRPIESSSLHIITSGPTPKDPVEMLYSDQMNILLQQLTERFDIVVIDTPALLGMADTTILAGLVDGVCLVVRQSYSKQESLKLACEQLRSTNARIVGLIINGLKPNNNYQYYKRRRK